MTLFLKKRRRSKAAFAPTWNIVTVLMPPPQFHTQNQIEAQRQRVRLQLRWNAMHRGDKPAFWPAALCAVQAFSPAAKTLAEGQFTCPEHLQYRRVERPGGAEEIK